MVSVAAFKFGQLFLDKQSESIFGRLLYFLIFILNRRFSEKSTVIISVKTLLRLTTVNNIIII